MSVQIRTLLRISTPPYLRYSFLLVIQFNYLYLILLKTLKQESCQHKDAGILSVFEKANTIMKRKLCQSGTLFTGSHETLSVLHLWAPMCAILAHILAVPTSVQAIHVSLPCPCSWLLPARSVMLSDNCTSTSS